MPLLVPSPESFSLSLILQFFTISFFRSFLCFSCWIFSHLFLDACLAFFFLADFFLPPFSIASTHQSVSFFVCTFSPHPFFFIRAISFSASDISSFCFFLAFLFRSLSFFLAPSERSLSLFSLSLNFRLRSVDVNAFGLASMVAIDLQL